MKEEKPAVAMNNNIQKEKREGRIASKITDGLQQIGTMGIEIRTAMSKMGDATSIALIKYRSSSPKVETEAVKCQGMSSAELEKELERINQELEKQKQILKTAQRKLAAYLENVGKDPEFGGGGSIE